MTFLNGLKIGIFLGLISVQLGCGKSFTKGSFNQSSFSESTNGARPQPDRGVPSLPGADPKTRGIQLYATHCSQCHFDLTDTTKRGATYARISGAIAEVRSMRTPALTALTEAQINDIVLALGASLGESADPDEPVTDPGTPAPPPVAPVPGDPAPITTSSIQSRPLIGTREYVSSAFKDIFGPAPGADPTSDETVILNKIDSLITTQAVAFGGRCGKKDANCPLAGITGEMLPRAHAMRKGYQLRACREILAINRAVSNALSRVSMTTSSLVNGQNIAKVYDLFSPGHVPRVNTIDALNDVAVEAATKGQGATDQWRNVLLPLCQSGVFDLL